MRSLNVMVMVGCTAAATLLAACSAGAPSAAKPQAKAEPTAQAGSVKAATQADQCEPGKEHWRSPGPPKRGGTLIRPASIEFFDPTRPTGSGEPAPQVYETLFGTRACRYGDTTMVPVLAKSYEVSPDGLTYTIKLRDNVKWHNKPPVNGRPFTSADVAWSIEFHKAGSVVRSFWEGVTHEEPDPQTIILRLKQPDADFVQKLGHYQNVMLAHEVKEQDGDFGKTAIGTGPFMLQDWKQGQEAVTVRNPDYYEMGDDGKPLPYADGLRSVNFNDYNAEVAAFRAGTLDYTGTFGMLKLEADAMHQASPNLRMTTEVQFTHADVWFRLDKKPWDDVRVRKAISLAVDREDLIASNRGGAIYAGYIPPAMEDYTWSDAKIRDKFKTDREAAKKLLAEAGIAPGSLNVTMKTSSQYAEDAEVVQQHLAAIGINAQVVVQGRNFSTILQARDYEDLAWGVVGGQPLLNYWVGDFIRTGASLNVIKFSDSQVDQLVDAQAREQDPAKRKEITDKLQDRLYDVIPYVPTVSRTYFHFTSCRIKNSSLAKPNHTHVSLKTAWIDPTGC
jgi:peptide/nickel transport system substrate-binding protein